MVSSGKGVADPGAGTRRKSPAGVLVGFLCSVGFQVSVQLDFSRRELEFLLPGFVAGFAHGNAMLAGIKLKDRRSVAHELAVNLNFCTVRRRSNGNFRD